jgi:7-cyano-7-deazaguanine synthase in queuosine biosynthesis
MKITCGPQHDRRDFEIVLPSEPKRLAVFVSGGVDSAILYYLLLLENRNLGNIHEIQPLMVQRKEGSKYFANIVVAHVRDHFNLAPATATIVGNNTLPEEEQVKSGVLESYLRGFDIAYTGLIQQLPQHMVNWEPIPYKQTPKFKAPFADLDKSHIIELCVQLDQTALFYLTHSCSAHEISRCRNCNGCNERSWGFDQLGIKDPGTI